MLPKVVSIALRSLWVGVYVRPGKYNKYSSEFNNIISGIDVEKGTSVTQEEIYTLYSSVRSVLDIEGAIAEIGVFQGTTARVICEIKGNKNLYLFDTFEGMPNNKIGQYDRWRKNTHRNTSLETVRSYLHAYPNVNYITGTFPESISQRLDLQNVRYVFVHIDVDLYQSTLDALEYFYPRMQKGGRLVSHNYNLKNDDGGNTPGVKKAFDEYFNGSWSPVIEIAETQCMVIKN